MDVEEQSDKPFVASRLVRGAGEGALWGGAFGLARGILRVINDPSQWLPEIGVSLLAGVIIGAVVFAIGRSIAGKVTGALIGALAGLIGGFFIGAWVGGYRWTVTEEANGTVTATGAPLGQLIGAAMGLVVVAVLGAVVERLIRGRAPTSESEG